MPEYDNTNRGALFRNDRRQSDKSPEYSGTLNVDGREFYLSAWVKQGKSGKFFSLSVKPKEGERASVGQAGPRPRIQPAQQPRVARRASADMDDPFA